MNPPSDFAHKATMKETGMDRLFANGTVNAAQSGKGFWVLNATTICSKR